MNSVFRQLLGNTDYHILLDKMMKMMAAIMAIEGSIAILLLIIYIHTMFLQGNLVSMQICIYIHTHARTHAGTQAHTHTLKTFDPEIDS